MGRTPDWERLQGTAASQGGHFTAAQAREAGFSTPLVNHHLCRRRFERTRRGIYRLVQWPPGEHEDLIVVWLWSDQRGVFSHETALALYELSDALPAKVHLTVPIQWARRRLRLPDHVVPHYADVGPADRSWVDCVPVTSPARTVLDCAADHVSRELVEQAIDEGRARGLFSEAMVAAAIAYVHAEPGGHG